MSEHVRSTRAQYLNGLAVAVAGASISAVLAGAPLWLLVPAAGTSGLLHWLALSAVAQRRQPDH